MRKYLTGPRDPEAQKVGDRIADTLTSATTVRIAEAAVPLSPDQEAAKGDGASAQMAEVSLQNRIQNFISATARKVWAVSSSKAVVAVNAVISADVISWITGNKLLIVKFYETITTQCPYWFDAIMKTISRTLM
ncbi:hypothetical protein [Falsihalocynthiibacter arcticus]|uniref:Uncharacterized protein n=1 Tax=Falsihalocynthiibacter arcticus TaxID=1579316 RepID=A0A126UZP4_9RHOB|nr:hypothetical protein [Falsihalocynthiibacter arcticus]AML51106.1 hypothetical protein RC74_07330 [Falsihalocynthiibacter arcticus]